MNIGVIGTGRMGRTLIEGLYSADHQAQVFAFNRTHEKALALNERFRNLEVLESAEALVDKCQIVVLAVPFAFIQNMTSSFLGVLEVSNPLVVVLCGYVPMKVLEKHLPCKIAKAFPNINWACGIGVTIVNFGKRLIATERAVIFQFLSKLSAVYEVSESAFRPLSNLMSCGPAIWLKLVDLFVEANVKKYGIDRKLAFEVSRKTILGTFELMRIKGYDTQEIVNLVSSPGGVTEVGLMCFEQNLPIIFSEALRKIGERDTERVGLLPSYE